MSDASFVYGFAEMPLAPVEVVSPGPQFMDAHVLRFTLTLPLRAAAPGAAPGK